MNDFVQKLRTLWITAALCQRTAVSGLWSLPHSNLQGDNELKKGSGEELVKNKAKNTTTNPKISYKVKKTE